MDIFNGLNKCQEDAVRCTEGPLLVLAGAGSGKTRVLTRRIAYLVREKGVSPFSILAITFTNKAAREMKERVELLLDNDMRNMWVSTFHSMCARILRRDIDKLGYERAFSIYDTDDQKSLLKECLKELNISDRDSDFSPRSVADVISRTKDDGVFPDKFAEYYINDYRTPKMSKIYSLYQKKLKERNALDFGDLIALTLKLFKESRETLEYYQRRFKYILVDEFQDTNAAQYKLVEQLAAEHGNLCVVGDDDQSIYSFRGADITNILNFEKDFPGCCVIKLEQNYRSTANIITAAGKVIENNIGRKLKTLWTDNVQGEKIKIMTALNAYDEASLIVRRIKECKRLEGKKNGDFAILYRVNALSRVIEEALIAEGLPYTIYGGLKFYDRKEIKDIIAYIRFVENPSDILSFKRIINVPARGIGQATVEKIVNFAAEKGINLIEAVKLLKGDAAFRRQSAGMDAFYRIITGLQGLRDTLPVHKLIEVAIENSGLKAEIMKEEKNSDNDRIGNMQELVSMAMDFEEQYLPDLIDAEAAEEAEVGAQSDAETDAGAPEQEVTMQRAALADVSVLTLFLEHIALITDTDRTGETADSVVLMTLHSAKGLEFPVVFIAGVEENIFPSWKSAGSAFQLEEERRLFYVGITRAKEELFISHSIERTIYGSTASSRPSRFLKELPEECVEKAVNAGYEKKGKQGRTKGGAAAAGAGKVGGFGISAYDFLSRVNSGNKADSTSSGVNGYGGTAAGARSRAGTRAGAGTQRARPSPGAVPNTPATDISEGDSVYHKKFGAGIVNSVKEEKGDFLITVEFENHGIRRLLGSMAKLEKI